MVGKISRTEKLLIKAGKARVNYFIYHGRIGGNPYLINAPSRFITLRESMIGHSQASEPQGAEEKTNPRRKGTMAVIHKLSSVQKLVRNRHPSCEKPA